MFLPILTFLVICMFGCSEGQVNDATLVSIVNQFMTSSIDANFSEVIVLTSKQFQTDESLHQHLSIFTAAQTNFKKFSATLIRYFSFSLNEFNF
jgi:hypothetical protein